MKLKKKILISLIATTITGYAIIVYEKESTTPNNLSSLRSSQSIECINSLHQSSPLGSSNLNRDEILKKSLKGYREQTYLGGEHAIIETTKDLNDKEFERFVKDEIKSKDLDIYWGAEY